MWETEQVAAHATKANESPRVLWRLFGLSQAITVAG